MGACVAETIAAIRPRPGVKSVNLSLGTQINKSLWSNDFFRRATVIKDVAILFFLIKVKDER